MNRKIVLPCTIVALLGVTVLSMPLFAPPPGSNNAGGGRLSPASLDLDTCGCPTMFDQPVCEERTEWSIEKTTESGPFVDPIAEPYSFTVTVTEGPTSTILSGTGMIVITNSGEQTPSLASVAVLLEQRTPGSGNAPGPSGNDWTILAAASQAEAAACGDTAVTCHGDFGPDAGTKLVLFNCDDRNDIIALSDSVLIPPTVDNDDDGLRDEDPPLPADPAKITGGCDVIDNDGDGLFDEDPIDFDAEGNPIDNDNDGLFNEDDPDDDGDGLVDEDGACEDAVIFCFEYEFDVSGLDLSGNGILGDDDDFRIDLLVTFDAIGGRGGTCRVDVDCDGTDEKDVRTIQQRLRFDLGPDPCTLVCDSVQLTDAGASANDPSCVLVTTSTLDEEIFATGVEGTETVRTISGTVTCINGECGTNVSNTATLECEDNSLITGSPASASFAVTCTEVPPDIEDGDFCSQTQGGWGQADNCDGPGNNVGRLRCLFFAAVFPSGLIVGDPDGPDADGSFAILLTSSAAVAEYLPNGGMPAALTADQTDPIMTSSGVFGAQLVAATLNVAFDDAGIGLCTLTASCTFPNPPGTLGTLIYGNCVVGGLQGLSVNDVIALSNTAISGGGLPAGVSFSNLSDALAKLNQEFVDCKTVATGCLTLP